MEEKMMILKMLEEGKITAEEAQKLLEAVGKNADNFGSDIRFNEKKFEEKMQKLQEKASKVAEKLGNTLNSGAEKFTSNSEKLGDDFGKRMESFGNDIAESAVKFTDRLVNYLGNFIDVGYDKYQYKKNFAYQLEDNAELSIDACNFAVIVDPTTEENLMINLYVNSIASDLVIDEYLKVEQVENKIKLQTQFPNRTWGKIEIMVPKHLSNLNIVTTNGKCELNDISADNIDSTTSNGRISFTGCQGETIKAATNNGKIVSTETSAAYADFSTSNGKVEIEDCKLDKLDAKTSNGAIVLSRLNKMTSAEGHYNLRTSNGKIIMELQENENFGCMIDAITSLGSITIDLPQLNYFVDKKTHSMQSAAKIKSANFDSAADKIFINAHTSNSSIAIETVK